MSNYSIWWLSQEDCEQMNNPELLSHLPDYIQRQFCSRFGRPGRGRLWVDSSIPVEGIQWNSEAPLADAALKCGGIVVRDADTAALAFFPGFVTDLSLEIIFV